MAATGTNRGQVLVFCDFDQLARSLLATRKPVQMNLVYPTSVISNYYV
jgi:hypothetical protein